MKKDRRFRLLLNPFQGKLVWRMVMYWAIYQVALWNFLFAWELIQEGPGNPIEQLTRFSASHYQMLFVLVLVVPFFAWDALRFSHCVAGPIYRLQKTLRAIKADEPLRKIRLRNGDHLVEVIDDLNDVLELLHQRGAVNLTDAPCSTCSGGSASFIRLCEDLTGLSHDDVRNPPTA